MGAADVHRRSGPVARIRDAGVLCAFLDVPVYLHGARSLESIIDMSALTGSLRYERSALPARHQLGLHVDPDAFLGLVRA